MTAKLPSRLRTACMAAWLAAVLAACPLQAAELRDGDKLYVSARLANLRLKPDSKAPILGQLPIGTEVELTDPVAGWGDHVCQGAKTPPDPAWTCVRIDQLLPSPDLMHWTGWIATDLLSGTAPTLKQLLANFDAAPASDLANRRKWAERAFELAPEDHAAQERLLAALEGSGDEKALQAARAAIEARKNAQVGGPGSSRMMFFHHDGWIEFNYRWGDKKTPDSADYMRRGKFFNVYSAGRFVGKVETQLQLDCAVQECAYSNKVRAIGDGATNILPDGIALNYTLPARADLPINDKEKGQLDAMARTWIKNRHWKSAKTRREFSDGVEYGTLETTYLAGHLANGKRLLVASWVLGTMSDLEYNKTPYESLLIIAEQQGDGKYVQANGSGSIAANGCALFDIADLDTDGSDDLVLRCDGVEDPSSSFKFMERDKHGWK